MPGRNTRFPTGVNVSGRYPEWPVFRCPLMAAFGCPPRLDGEDLLLVIDTDLPDEGELSVSVSRSYYEVGNDAEYARDYLSVVEPVSRWREPRRGSARCGRVAGRSRSTSEPYGGDRGSGTAGGRSG